MVIKELETGIDVSELVEELAQHPEDWQYNTYRQEDIEAQQHTETISLIGVHIPEGFTRWKANNAPGNSLCSTPITNHYPKAMAWMRARFPLPDFSLQRCAYVKLKPLKEVYAHIDEGTYYAERERYHLSITGRYEYFVGDESLIVEPGTLFWFDNTIMHSSRNLEDEDRIVLVFDIYHYQTTMP